MRRRDLLKLAATSAAALAAGRAPFSAQPRARAQAISAQEKFLFVVTAWGGAGMLDAFFPVLRSEVTGSNATSLTTYAATQLAQPRGSNLRCVKHTTDSGLFTSPFPLDTLLRKHYADMTLVTVQNTSVNHLVAQKRAVTGSGINGGRTIMEAVAMRHGQKKLIANCNMGAGGFTDPGDDVSVPAWARAELINSPTLFPLATDSSRGLAAVPSPEQVAHARAVRSELEQASPFAARHGDSQLRKRFLELRDHLSSDLMTADLISKLMVIPDQGNPTVKGGLPLKARDLESSPYGQKVWSAFPDVMTDTLHAQGALAFLLARCGVSNVVTLGPGGRPVFLEDGTILGSPLSFDYSHISHPIAQSVMWSRVCMQLDGLITLLKNEPLGDGSMWDRSFIYVATDFGRSRDRPQGASSWSSAHHLNNANLFISPMLKGNRVFGGIDYGTLEFYGFDRQNGEPAQGTAMREGDLYSLVAHALDVDFAGRTDMRAVLR